MLTLLPARDRRPMAWKNGLGVTTEIAIGPPDAGLGGFDWRVSTAEVAASGPFSDFPGVDRWLLVLAGEMTLSIADAAPLPLSPASDPAEFPGDVAVTAEVTRGPVRDLNIMTARDRVSADIRLVSLDAGQAQALSGETLVLCLEGSARVTAGDASAELGAMDAARLQGLAQVSAAAEARLVIARFEPRG